MNVYYIISYDIHNSEEYQKYPQGVLPLFEKYGAEILVSDREAMLIEGSTKTMNAVVKFPSKEIALQCYHDPAYQEVKKIRINSTSNCSIVLAKEFEKAQ
ncbi:DUF1330 domain-containing protein [Chryseolinea sp. H1M3-3]|uniref:DUF1330 domain-containing protein n=1 Tax=Chryseolinea sp. H1M3-3 TaxID=3034144 RepID=UPI0023ED56B4|nr:DUF1330 domain-containing protein [Chryseolinea sp. H1M3-3]